MRKRPSKANNCEELTMSVNEKGKIDRDSKKPNKGLSANNYKDTKSPTSNLSSNLSSFNPTSQFSNITKIAHDNVFERMKHAKQPNAELLDRLSMGHKTKISKKDMLALTNKNYNL